MLARKLAWLGLVAIIGWTSIAGQCAAASVEIVQFRLGKWKSAHFSAEKDAQKVFDTLKQLGCEVKKEAHDGHSDIVYRCADWKTVKSKTHDEAHKWEKWLNTYGFETKHEH